MGYFFMHPSVSDERSKSSCVRFFSPILRSRGIKATPSLLALSLPPTSFVLLVHLYLLDQGCLLSVSDFIVARPPSGHLFEIWSFATPCQVCAKIFRPGLMFCSSNDINLDLFHGSSGSESGYFPQLFLPLAQTFSCFFARAHCRRRSKYDTWDLASVCQSGRQGDDALDYSNVQLNLELRCGSIRITNICVFSSCVLK